MSLAAWPAFLDGARIDAAESALADRVRTLQVLRMLEQLATGNLTPGIARIVTDRLHATLALPARTPADVPRTARTKTQRRRPVSI